MRSARATAVMLLYCASALTLAQHPLSAGGQEPATSRDDSSPPSATKTRKREIERASRLVEAGQTDKAIRLLRQVLSDQPDNADAHLLLGTALALAPQESEALQELRRAVALRPTSARGYYTLGTALARFGQLAPGQAAFEKALALDPRLADAHVGLGLVLAQQKELGLAQEQFEAAVNLDGTAPTAAYPHYLLGKIFAEQRQWPEALKELEIAIRLRPAYSAAYLTEGDVRKELGDHAQAIASFKRAAALDPTSAQAQERVAEEYAHLGRFEEAVAPFEKAARMEPRDRYVIYQLCQALQKTHRTEEAQVCEQKLSALIRAGLETDETMLAASRLNNEGVDLDKRGDYNGALAKYRAALKLNPAQTAFRRNLGLVLCRLERWQEGIAELRTVLKKDPGDPEARKALYIALDNAHAAEAQNNGDGKKKPQP